MLGFSKFAPKNRLNWRFDDFGGLGNLHFSMVFPPNSTVVDANNPSRIGVTTGQSRPLGGANAVEVVWDRTTGDTFQNRSCGCLSVKIQPSRAKLPLVTSEAPTIFGGF